MKMVSNSRAIETSKSQRTSDPEIKAIQKRAVYQFYLKQKQKEKQEKSEKSNHSNTNLNSNGNAGVTTATNDDNSQVWLPIFNTIICKRIDSSVKHILSYSSILSLFMVESL